MDKMVYWNAMCRPPQEALKKITGGRLSGMSDISPQWRMKIMTQQFGACGIGWKYEIKKFWDLDTEPEKMAFCHIELFYKTEDGWSEPIPGIGGSMLTAQEKAGLHNSDEAYKMAMTDALSVAMKALGVAADIYEGKWDGTKYKDEVKPPPLSAREQKELDNGFLANLDTALKNAVNAGLLTDDKWDETLAIAKEKTGKELSGYCDEVLKHLVKLGDAK